MAFVTMFRVAVGETWLGDGVPIRYDDGSANYPAIVFYILFVLMVNWTLLQACVAVMIDSFINHSAEAQQEEILRLKDEQKNQRTIRSSLDPLLERLIRDYSDEKDLTTRIQSLFRVLSCPLMKIVPQTPYLRQTMRLSFLLVKLIRILSS